MKESEIARLKGIKEYETKLHETGVLYIAGIDEAGRGPLAGPVTVGAVIMKPDSFIEGINDSKKISETKREKLYEKITEEAYIYNRYETLQKHSAFCQRFRSFYLRRNVRRYGNARKGQRTQAYDFCRSGNHGQGSECPGDVADALFAFAFQTEGIHR